MTSLRHGAPALLCILLSIMVLWSTRGFAQTPLSLSEAVSFALSNRPEIRAALDRTAAAEHLQKQAGVIPNPRIFLQSEDLRSSHFNFWQDSETFAYAAETVETSGRRAGRIATATQQLAGSRLRAEQVRLQIALGVRQAYWTALAAQRLAQLYQEDRDYFRQIISYHEARFHEGKLAEVDLLLVRIEGERVHAAEARARLESQRALRQCRSGSFTRYIHENQLLPDRETLWSRQLPACGRRRLDRRDSNRSGNFWYRARDRPL